MCDAVSLLFFALSHNLRALPALALSHWAMGGTDSLVVYDLNDGCKLSGVWAGTEERDTANLDRLPRTRDYVGVAHFEGVCGWSVVWGGMVLSIWDEVGVLGEI